MLMRVYNDVILRLTTPYWPGHGTCMNELLLPYRVASHSRTCWEQATSVPLISPAPRTYTFPPFCLLLLPWTVQSFNYCACGCLPLEVFYDDGILPDWYLVALLPVSTPKLDTAASDFLELGTGHQLQGGGGATKRKTFCALLPQDREKLFKLIYYISDTYCYCSY